MVPDAEHSECLLLKYTSTNEVRKANTFYRAVWNLSLHAADSLRSTQNEVTPVSRSVVFFDCLFKLVRIKSIFVRVDEVSVVGTVKVGTTLYRIHFDWKNTFKVLRVEDETGNVCSGIMQACSSLSYPRDMHLAIKLLGETLSD
jgi:predicted alternative tryptophan synthase beta-subunit